MINHHMLKNECPNSISNHQKSSIVINNHHHPQSSGWWLTYPSERYEFVKWDYEIPKIWKVKIQSCSSHHQMFQSQYHGIMDIILRSFFSNDGNQTFVQSMNIHQFYGDVNGCVHGNVNPLKQCQSIPTLNGDVFYDVNGRESTNFMEM